MPVSLNSEQARGLANFFFDVAKGLVLGGIGFAATTSSELKLIEVCLTTIFAFVCVKFALALLENVR